MQLDPFQNTNLFINSVSITGGFILLIHLVVGNRYRFLNVLQDSTIGIPSESDNRASTFDIGKGLITPHSIEEGNRLMYILIKSNLCIPISFAIIVIVIILFLYLYPILSKNTL